MLEVKRESWKKNISTKLVQVVNKPVLTLVSCTVDDKMCYISNLHWKFYLPVNFKNQCHGECKSPLQGSAPSDTFPLPPSDCHFPYCSQEYIRGLLCTLAAVYGIVLMVAGYYVRTSPRQTKSFITMWSDAILK